MLIRKLLFHVWSRYLTCSVFHLFTSLQFYIFTVSRVLCCAQQQIKHLTSVSSRFPGDRNLVVCFDGYHSSIWNRLVFIYVSYVTSTTLQWMKLSWSKQISATLLFDNLMAVKLMCLPWFGGSWHSRPRPRTCIDLVPTGCGSKLPSGELQTTNSDSSQNVTSASTNYLLQIRAEKSIVASLRSEMQTPLRCRSLRTKARLTNWVVKFWIAWDSIACISWRSECCKVIISSRFEPAGSVPLK